MSSREWLKASTVLAAADVATVDELVRTVAESMAGAVQEDARRIESLFAERLQSEGYSIGGGVAIPHTEMESLTETVVCLVTLRRPLNLPTIDERSPDVFFFILSKPDPHDHLLLLAHLARLAQSRTLLDGLRRAQTPEEIVKLVHAAEQRHKALEGPSTGPSTGPPSTSHALVVVSIGGENVVDALLINLVGQGFGDACVLDAQSLHEAATRELPLFAGFRDLFGDPGGRRILILEAPADRTDAIIEAVRRISEEHRAKDARVTVVPVQARWVGAPAIEKETAGGH